MSLDRMLAVAVVWLSILGPVSGGPPVAATPAEQSSAPAEKAAEAVLWRGEKPFVFGFAEWEKAPTLFPVEKEGVRIKAANGRGGAGVTGLQAATRQRGPWSPVLTLTVGPENQAAQINLHLTDGDGTEHAYTFELAGLARNQRQTLTPKFGASLDEPNKSVKPGDAPGLGDVKLLLIIGDWTDKRVDVAISAVGLTPPNEKLLAQRAELRAIKAREEEQARREAEAREKARRALLERGAPHPADGPSVEHLCAVAPDVLAVVIQAGRHVNNQLAPYEKQADDQLIAEPRAKPRLEVIDGKVVELPLLAVVRKSNGKAEKLGLLAADGKHLFIEGKSEGQPLDETVADVPAAYQITSADDPAYAQPQPPTAVYRKGKPKGHSQPLPFRYVISLKLPSPLRENARYTVRFHGINTASETAEYRHEPRRMRSEAVHAIQTGYRPDDPYKRAYVSFWMGVDLNGKHGSCTPEVADFELIDAAGATAYRGKAELAKPDGREERISIHEAVDYSKAAVYRLDFSDFRRPGEYRVFVPGVGVSGPFRIADDVWERPFLAAMRAVLVQRQAIELGPPMCGYRRGRPFHPDDGVQFYQLSIPVQAGQEGTRGENLVELARSGSLQRVEGIWGAYQDAGDWDTLGHHLSATLDLLGLYDLNPEAFRKVRLSLPADEMNDRLPDILNEALWQMPCWRRLQLPDGAVRGGYGYGWGCPPATTSSMLRSAGVYAPDHVTTLHYAAAAARAARVLKAFDPARAEEYLASARKAWAWAEKHGSPTDPEYQRVAKFDRDFARHLRDHRALAAVELLAATGQNAFDEAFRQSSELADRSALYMDQLPANFAYARLPDALGDAQWKRAAVERIVKYADHAIAFSRNNAFDIITGHRTDMPMIFVSRYFSTPGAAGMALIYAYELTGKPEYLRAAVQGSNYCLGANPDNLSYCTGVGDNAQRYNFIVDAQITGQMPDSIVGHIPYGQGNEGNSMSRSANSWVQQWLLNFGPAKKMTPSWYDWPVYEQYVDFARYPLHNENCFNQTSVPAACYWFYLHFRPDKPR